MQRTARQIIDEESRLRDIVEADIKSHPERLQAFDCALHDRLKALVGDIDIDLDEPLSPEDE